MLTGAWSWRKKRRAQPLVRYYGRNESGQQGIFPKTYVEIVPETHVVPVVSRGATVPAAFQYQSQLPHPSLR